MQMLDIICVTKEDYIIAGQKTLTLGNTVTFIKNTTQISSWSLNEIIAEFKRGCKEGCLPLSIRD